MFRVLLLSILLFTACQTERLKKDKLRIAVASSAQFAFQEIGNAFTKENNISVEYVSGSSGKMTTQILNGAPYDIFISADMKFPLRIKQAGKCEGRVQVYGYGVPVLWTINPTIHLDSMYSMIYNNTIKRMAIADPNAAPYGTMAIKYLSQFKNNDFINSKLVYGVNISQVNDYVLNNSVDIGITAKSVVCASKLNNKGRYKELSKEYYIEQGMIIINNKTSTEIKRKFIDFVLSQKGKSILHKYGFEAKK